MLEVLPSSICEHMYIIIQVVLAKQLWYWYADGAFITMAIDQFNYYVKLGRLLWSVDGSIMKFKTKLKNLGVIFDSNLTFEPHVQGTVKTIFSS